MHLLASAAPKIGADKIDVSLQSILENADPNDDVAIIVHLSDKVDIKTLRSDLVAELHLRYPNGDVPKKYRKALKRLLLTQRLKEKSNNSKRPVENLLRRNGENRQLKQLWAINAVAGKVPARLVKKLAKMPTVEIIKLDAIVQGPGPGTAPTAPPGWNLEMVQAPALWQLGYTGLNVVVATMDTGADITHPDLSPNWRGGTNSWFDAYGQHATPTDDSGSSTGHGTGVLGLMVGGSSQAAIKSV